MHDDNSDEANVQIPNGATQPQVGYARPPAARQFKKGKSGNPKGRPKGAEGKRKIAKDVLHQLHEFIEGGRKVQRTTLELIFLRLRNRAAEGNHRAFKALEKLDLEYDPQQPKSPAGVLVVPGRLTKESWVKLFSPKNDPTQKGEGEDE